MKSRNIAARAGRWSAKHRKTAIFGWLAFVVIAFVIGGAVGQNTIAEEDYGNGSSGSPTRRSRPPTSPTARTSRSSSQGRGDVKTGDPAVHRRGRRHRRAGSRRPKHVEKFESPLASGNEGQLSKDGHSALVTFEIAGDDDAGGGPRRRDARRDRRRPEGEPGVFVEQFGDASADKAISKAFEDDFKKAEMLSLPDHAADPRRRLRRARRRRHPAAARPVRRDRDARPRRAAEPDRPDRRGRRAR